MIYVLEGCTCSGKSTMAKKLSEEMQIEIAPKHTPEPMKTGDSILARQEMVFTSFVNQYLAMILSGKDYIADFSPWGVIPFSIAYAKYLNNDVTFELLSLAQSQHLFLNELKRYYEEQLNQKLYLHADFQTITDRLKSRGRIGDDFWNENFIKRLVDEYNRYFCKWNDNV